MKYIMKKGYLANGLFNESDRMYNHYLARNIRHTLNDDVDLYVPQENAEVNDKSLYANSMAIEKADTTKLLESDFLVAVIDGQDIDSGVSAEIGIFSTTNKPIFALYTDVRQQGRDNKSKIQALIDDGVENQFMYRNLYVIGLIKRVAEEHGGGIYSSSNDLLGAIKDFYC